MRRVAVAMMVGGLAALTPAITMGQSRAAELVVKVYNAYGISGAEMIAARGTLRAVLEPAGIAADWRDCTAIEAAGPSRLSCDHQLKPHEVLVRLVASSPAAPLRVLGSSSVQLQQSAGSLATVWADRVEAMAGRTQSAAGTLLGRVIAHEVGHLLLGTNTHSTAGLMRAQWSDEEVRRDRPTDWLLLWSDARQVHQALLDRSKRLAPVLSIARSTF